MKIITVSGSHSGVGKTMIAEILLRRLKGWSALKITVSHNGSCPTHRDCGACDDLHSQFIIENNKDLIGQKDKDTQRLKTAGAREVFWLRSKPRALKNGITKALALFRKTKGLIIESNSVLKYLKPDLAIFVERKNSILKPSAKKIFNKVDLVITI